MSYSLDDSYITNANKVLEVLAYQLAIDGIIENQEVITSRYVVGLAKPGIFTRWFDKIMRIKPNDKCLNSGYYVIFQIPKRPPLVESTEESEELTNV